MKVLSLICQKGGTAKTTTAINLAVEALAYGLEVVVIDLDPQVSACDWKDIRGDEPPLADEQGAVLEARNARSDQSTHVLDRACVSPGTALSPTSPWRLWR